MFDQLDPQWSAPSKYQKKVEKANIAFREMLATLEAFPGHQSENSWYEWISRKNKAMKLARECLQ